MKMLSRLGKARKFHSELRNRSLHSYTWDGKGHALFEIAAEPQLRTISKSIIDSILSKCPSVNVCDRGTSSRVLEKLHKWQISGRCIYCLNTSHMYSPSSRRARIGMENSSVGRAYQWNKLGYDNTRKNLLQGKNEFQLANEVQHLDTEV